MAELRRTGNSTAPKTVHNIYGVLKALFRDAHLADLVTASPCILTRHQLGENVDKDPTWRATTVFTRNELEMLISLARTDGARRDILELCAHTPRKSGNTIDLYTTFPWETLCAEVAKLKVQRHECGQLARLALAASAEKENPGSPDGGRGSFTSSGSGRNRTRRWKLPARALQNGREWFP
ncbi:MAG TPA: hypothetical protein VEU33_34535 [Archangium sp.]|nr:hypothetical protein [Archangium sp.]